MRSTEYRLKFGLLTILLVGFALRLYRLGADSLWYDETVSAFLANQPAADLVAHTARDIHPPGYYLLLRGWTLLVGDREFALAFFSLMFGLLLVALTYRLARDVAGAAVAWWTALFVAVSPYNLWYSQEVRMYTLGAFLGLLATWCLLKAWGRGWSQARWLWLGYIVCAVLGLYTLYYFAFLLIVVNLIFLGGWWGAGQTGVPHEHDFRAESTQRPSAPPLRGIEGGRIVHKPSDLPWKRTLKALLPLLVANLLIILVYLPWLPIAWRQATNPPVPPWRTPQGLSATLLETWSALSLGQSVHPNQVWPFLILTIVLFITGLIYLQKNKQPTFQPFDFAQDKPTNLPTSPTPLLSPISQSPNLPISPAPLLLLYTIGPFLLILLTSLITPLYHVRYIFTYSPPFYIVLGAGIVWIARRTGRGLALTGALLLLYAFGFSIYQYHTNPRYRADDFRAAIAFIEDHWQPGDVIMTNAGYTYTAFVYYADMPNLARRRFVPNPPPGDPTQPILLQTGTVDGSPQLGWGDPRSDFYAMSATDTVAALEQLSQDYARLWLLRVYDTVTDPQGLIRDWLAENTIPLEDQGFAGESFMRVQGFLLHKQSPLGGGTVYFEDGMVLAGWDLPLHPWQAGQTIPLKLGWLATQPPSVDYKMSLKLWTDTGEFAAQGQDTWPVGTLYRATAWPPNQTIYQPAALTLPADLPAGQYWLNVELYHPETGQPLPRLDGQDPVVTLGPVVVE